LIQLTQKYTNNCNN